MRLRSDPIHPLLAALLLVASALMCWSGELPEAPRTALVVGYLLLAPGYAVLPFFGRDHLVFHGLLCLCLGIALATGISTGMSETGWWHVPVGMVATWLLVVILVSWRVWRNRAAVVRLAGRLS